MISADTKEFSDLVKSRVPVAASVDFETHGTTVLSLRYENGILTLADRRATMGNLIMYDNAEKIVALDDHTLVAISGSFARSIEVCRLLKHSFKYYSRMHLQDMSLEGKLQEISRVLAQNMPQAMNGIGLFIPILSSYEKSTDEFCIWFFDGAGARFENRQYACAGSGSERIRGIFEYVRRNEGSWSERPFEQVLLDGMRMLDIAADLDSATGGFGKILPAARVLDRQGTRAVPEEQVRDVADQVLGKAPHELGA